MKMSGVFSRKSYLAGMLAMVMLPLSAQAYIQGEVQAANGTHVYNVPLGTSDIVKNEANETISAEFSLDATYNSVAYCPDADIVTYQPVYYETRASLPSIDDGYMALNEYLDVKVEIFIDGNVGEYFAVPFPPTSNKYPVNLCHDGREDLKVLFGSGGKGRVTFKIKKPIINGINLSGTEVAQLYGRLGEGIMGSTPMATINILSAVITVPDKCVINEGRPVEIDFGIIGGRSKDLTGDNPDHIKTEDINIKCEGGSFTTGYFDVKVAIQPANGITSFNSNYLATTGGGVDRSDLGIVIRERSGTTIVPNTYYQIPGFANNQGTWKLDFAPIANPASTAIPEGDFQSSATIIAQFP